MILWFLKKKVSSKPPKHSNLRFPSVEKPRHGIYLSAAGLKLLGKLGYEFYRGLLKGKIDIEDLGTMKGCHARVKLIRIGRSGIAVKTMRSSAEMQKSVGAKESGITQAISTRNFERAVKEGQKLYPIKGQFSYSGRKIPWLFEEIKPVPIAVATENKVITELIQLPNYAEFLKRKPELKDKLDAAVIDFMSFAEKASEPRIQPDSEILIEYNKKEGKFTFYVVDIYQHKTARKEKEVIDKLTNMRDLFK